ncbi:MAG: dethiobiotin synthase [bacterium]
MNIFITGTDTDVGKTVVTAGIAAVMQSLGYSVGVYKPVQSGAVKKNNEYFSPDLCFVNLIDPHIKTKCSYYFNYPVSPYLAAIIEKVSVDKKKLLQDYNEFRNECDFILVEGAGGLLVPIYHDYLMANLAKDLQTPLVIVAKPDLGTINHTLLTIEAAKSRNIQIAGVIISNYPQNTKDIAMRTASHFIKELSGVEVLGTLPRIESLRKGLINPEQLIDAVINNIDVQSLFKLKIPKLSV